MRSSHCSFQHAVRLNNPRARLRTRPFACAAMGGGVAEIQGRVWALAQTPGGSWAVQNALERLTSDADRLRLVQELRGHTWEALQCPHANHVLQKCVAVLRAGAAQFIVDELLASGPGAIGRAAKHRYGCRVVQRLLEHLSAPLLEDIVKELLAGAVKLSTHMYANYVIRCLLEHGPEEARRNVALALGQHIGTVFRSRFGLAVIADALVFGSDEEHRALANTLAAGDEWLHRVSKANSRHIPIIAHRMVELLSEHKLQPLRDILEATEHGMEKRRAGRKLLAMRENWPTHRGIA